MSKHVGLGRLLEVEMWKVKSVKTRQVRTTFGRGDVENVHGIVARSTFWVKSGKARRSRTTFGRADVEKVHAAVARSTF